MTRNELKPTEFNEYYTRYIDLVTETTELTESFKEGKRTVLDFFSSINENKLEYRYQPEKWSIKEILQHLIDTERIFLYRCFRIARRDTTALAGYDQNIYIEPSGANNKSISILLEEFRINRDNSISILQSLSNEDLSFIGTSNGSKMSARAAAFVIPGHDIWHMNVIKEKYL